MSQIRINNLTNKIGDNGPTVAGICTVSSNAFMVMPSGDTAIRDAGSGRGIHAGGSNSPSAPNGTDVADYFTIATTGNAVDFGDLQHQKRLSNMGSSDSHGGLIQ